MTATHFPVSDALKEQIRSTLQANGHTETADQVAKQHPATLGPEYIFPTGGGCEAYFVDVRCDGFPVLVVWTDPSGTDLPTETQYMIGVYEGEAITEDHLALIEGSRDLARAKALWAKLGTIPVDQNGEIEEPFEHFARGTEKEAIWHWLEATYHCSVAVDLMGQ